MNRPLLKKLCVLAAFGVVSLLPNDAAASEGHGASSSVWLALGMIVLLAKLAGEIAIRMKQPAVFGELLAGVLLGNLDVVGIPFFAKVATSAEMTFAAELGVVLLLFEVGIESSVGEMKAVAKDAGAVAVVGVVLPALLGMGASRLLLPTSPFLLHLFVGATLSATSVGVSARVLRDLGATDKREARVILGAAVLDDVLGLIVLAIVTSIAASGGLPRVSEIVRLSATAIGFLVGALIAGLFVTRRLFRFAARLQSPHVLGALAIALCFLFASLSVQAGLAAIVGAFAAGLVLDDVSVKPFGEESMKGLETFVGPIVALFAPIFFAKTGMGVRLSGLDGTTIALAFAVTVVAVIGKLACGSVVRGGVDRLTVGLGMVPRGEVGLIFADAGAKIMVGGTALIGNQTYSALVLMVIFTTMVTPPLLSWRIKKTSVANTSEPSVV